MTRPFNTQKLQFYMTIPSPCPYLTGRKERKIFTQLDPLTGPYLNNYLTHSGFRRSQNVLYRPACENCRSCQSLRVVVKDFKPSRSLRRILSKNVELTRSIKPALATREQFDLLQTYLQSRHPEGGMNDMDYVRYEMMVEECSAETQIAEYRAADNALIACALIDVLMDGYSMVYSFFDPEFRSKSLGSYMILDQISRAQQNDVEWLYLGYWVKDSPKMDYKSRFQPCQVLKNDGWQNLKRESSIKEQTAPNDVRGITQTDIL